MFPAIRSFVIVLALLLFTSCSSINPADDAPSLNRFVNLGDYMVQHDQSIEVDVRYFGTDNFLGAKVNGYSAEKIYLTQEAATALLAVQKTLAAQGFAIKVFDAYRPQRAVDHFVLWARDLNDVRMKAKYYPGVDKKDLFRDGYIAARSGHSRGSTVDLTIISLADKTELDMGASWDFFDPLSWPASDQVSLQQRKNRDYLRDVMVRAGFKPLKEEWWHYTLKNEPFPDQYFDFIVK
jgi:D-alanyl-D-alanine dipeptidase